MKIPVVPCREGCADCCCPVPFTKSEWMAVPEQFKKGLDIRFSRNALGKKMVVAFCKGFVPRRFGKFISLDQMGKVCRRGGEVEIAASCPFCVDSRCQIYEYRPMVCIMFGTVDFGLLACKHGCLPAKPLTKMELAELTLAWFHDSERRWEWGDSAGEPPKDATSNLS